MVINVMTIRPLLIISALFCLILPAGLYAQEETSIDSLVSLLASSEGKEHLEILYELSENRWLAFEDRLSYTEDAIDYAARSGEVRWLYDAHLHQGKVFSREAMDQKALESFEKALKISEESGDDDGIIHSLFWIGKTYSWLRDPDMAAEYLNRTRRMAAEHKNEPMETDALYWLGELNRRFREYEDAMAYYDTAYAMAEAAGSVKMMAEINASQGMVMYYQGEFLQAVGYYEKAIGLFHELSDEESESSNLLRLANTNYQLARYDISLGHYQKALSIFEKINHEAGMIAVLNGMALIYFSQEQFEKALETHLKLLSMNRARQNQEEIGRSLHNIGTVYNKMAGDSLVARFGDFYMDSIKNEPSDKYLNLFRKALDYYEQALEVWEKEDYKEGIKGSLHNIGIIYVTAGMPEKALPYLRRALAIAQELNDRAVESSIYLRLGQVYILFENYGMASEYLNKSLELAMELDTKETLMGVYEVFSDLYAKQGRYRDALRSFKLHAAIKDTITKKERLDQITEMQVKYETEATEKENALLLAESELADIRLKQTRIILTITIIAIVIFLIMVVQLVRANNLKKKANIELAQKNMLITEQKKEITDSIEYASRIQNAMLPPGDYLDSLLPERFIIFKPRDIVSGDFYYITEKNGKVICVAADCTGHGVPGALMSMLGISFLNEIISKHRDLPHSNEILEELRAHVIKSLHQTGRIGESQDGMDLSLYIVDMKTRKMEFSGANNSLWLIRDGELIERRADKMPIGIYSWVDDSFTRHEVDLQKGDMVYSFSDGYADQIGGPSQKKFMSKNFKKMLLRIHTKSMQEQQRIMVETLEEWMKDTSQVDDILVVGVRV
jgi:serine phosphatase RsbU (regulator of sigma subunit)/tetratricopeptide (TPR) repeat protein